VKDFFKGDREDDPTLKTSDGESILPDGSLLPDPNPPTNDAPNAIDLELAERTFSEKTDIDYVPDIPTILRKRTVPDDVPDVFLATIGLLSKFIQDYSGVPSEEADASVLLLIQGETSFKWPPPVRLTPTGKPTRFGAIQISPFIAVSLSRKYNFPLDPGDPDMMNFLYVAYFYDSGNIIDALLQPDPLSGFKRRFAELSRWLKADISTSEIKHVALIVYHRGGFDPSAPFFDSDVRNDVLSRLPLSYLNTRLQEEIKKSQ
jgi:hypothetical protein